MKTARFILTWLALFLLVCWFIGGIAGLVWLSDHHPSLGRFAGLGVAGVLLGVLTFYAAREFRPKAHVTHTYTTMTPDQQAAFARVFAQMDMTMKAMDAAFETVTPANLNRDKRPHS